MKTKKTRIVITYIVLFALLLGAILLSLYIGSVSIAPQQVFSVLTGHETDAKAMQIILSIRLPRVLAAAILGGALAVSGFLLQTFFRNPIAGPFVLGISSGAKLVVALAMIVGVSHGITMSSWFMIAMALIGSLLSMLFVLASGEAHPRRRWVKIIDELSHTGGRGKSKVFRQGWGVD